jgi:Protein of unknown function (DUF1091)
VPAFIQAHVVVQNLLVTGAPEWTTTSSYLTNDSATGRQFLSIDMTVFKRLQVKVMLVFKLYRMEMQTKVKMFHIPKLNYCDLRQASGVVPMVSSILKSTAKFGNLVFKCPAVPGNYSMRNYPMGGLTIGAMIPSGRYVIQLDLIDENRVNHPVAFLKVECHMVKL